MGEETHSETQRDVDAEKSVDMWTGLVIAIRRFHASAILKSKARLQWEETRKYCLQSQVTDNTRVCSKHFTPDCIARSLTGLHKLNHGGVATLFTWSCELKPRRTLERHQSVNDIETFEEDEEENHSFSDQNTGEQRAAECSTEGDCSSDKRK
ncbi:uncharacterized protein LOC127953449 isoform X1 [Carassius gibelio]|uniref:uncharacterized protein LOC127953449 isoform X1 n=1 Tax=Carassius gibelio TaxID=101364 RepID=UPI00227764D7|nr:uncharacterized protein LOC127953449 isoform X1 [Carassius gibelio]